MRRKRSVVRGVSERKIEVGRRKKLKIEVRVIESLRIRRGIRRRKRRRIELRRRNGSELRRRNERRRRKNLKIGVEIELEIWRRRRIGIVRGLVMDMIRNMKLLKIEKDIMISWDIIMM